MPSSTPRSRTGLSGSVSPVPPSAGGAGPAQPVPCPCTASPAPAGRRGPPGTRHLELQQLLGLFRRQLPFLRRRHFAAASDPPLRHSPEVTPLAPTSTPAPRGAANGCLSATAGTAVPHSGHNRSALGPVRRCPNPIGGAGRSRVSPAGARKVPKCVEHRSGVPGGQTRSSEACQGLLGCSRNRPGMRGQPVAVGAGPEWGDMSRRPPGAGCVAVTAGAAGHRVGPARAPPVPWGGSCPLPPVPPGGSCPAPLVPLGRPFAGPKMAAAAKMEEAVRGPRSHPQLRAPA